MDKKIVVKKNIPLAPISTFGIGGKAKLFIDVQEEDSFKNAIDWAKNEGLNIKVCAGTSNIVFPDEDMEDVLIRKRGGKIEQASEEKLMVDAGVMLQDLVDFANKKGLEGLESLAGIPGTVGGAVVGNAGAYGRSISEVVKRVKVLEEDPNKDKGYKHTFWITSEECGFDYRESNFKKFPIFATKVRLLLKKSNPQKLQKKSLEILKERETKYKPGLRCPGSFFKNILVKNVSQKTVDIIPKEKIIEGKIPAGYLLEQVGAKGMKEGGIKIADFHGNLFINEKNGTAKDVRKLAVTLKEKVKKKYGIELEEEVRYF